MKYTLLIFVSILVFVTSCKDDDVVDNRVIFKFTLKDPIYATADRWIILRDNESGEVIDSRQVQKNETAIFESTKKIPSGKMTVTFFRAYDSPTARAQVYSGVDVGSEWTSSEDLRNKAKPDGPETSGTYNLRIINAPTLYSFTLSDENGPTNMNTKAVNDNGIITLEAGFTTGNRQMVSIDPLEGNQRYAFIEDIDFNENIVLDYNDFKEFDRYIGLSMLYGDIQVRAYPTVAKFYNGYDTYYNNEYGSSESLTKEVMKLGVLEEFKTYRITLNLNRIEYRFLGPPPSSIDPMRGEFVEGFVLAETDFANYKLETTSDYNHRYVNYHYNGQRASDRSLDVEYYGPKGDWKLPDALTDEIIAKYSLKMDQPKYGLTEVSLGTETYEKLLDYYFSADYDPGEPFEITTVYVKTAN